MSTVAMRTTTVRYQKKLPVVASIDFDNNNASILYNSITKSYVAGSFPVSNISVIEDGKDISQKAEIYVKVHGLSARIKGRGYSIPLSGSSSATLTTGKGGIVSVTVESVESTGYVLAKYTDSAGVAHTTKFNVSRSVGRYAVEIITTPTQISYNQTTGIASSSTITATLNVIDIYGNRTSGAQFDTFGAMQWRYVGETDWRDPALGQSISVLKITNPDFTKGGVEFAFFDGSNNQLDYETVPFSSVTNGGDAFLVNVASMNVAVVLTSISYGTPTGDVTNVVYMTKNNAVLSSGVEYNVPGDNGDENTLAANGDKASLSYNGWVFNYLYLNGRLTSSLVRVEENSPTSVHIPIDVKYPTDNITRTVMISYSAIQKGPAGRSYKPNTPELYDPKKKYVWNDAQRDFIYYAFKVDENGEQDDEKGVLSYFQYGVKEYGMKGISAPPKYKDGDTNWELVSEYKSIIVNCLFGTNAVLGGMVFTADTQTSVSEYSKGVPNIIINGRDGTFVANTATIRGEVNATQGSFDRCTINNTCRILQNNGNGWFLVGGTDPTADAPNGKPSWWLGYSGNTVGSFSMESAYQEEGYLPARVKMSIQTPRITSTGTDGGTMLDIYSNINHQLAYISHAFGMGVAICPTEGIGLRFDNNTGDSNFNAFIGAGHGCLNGVIQGYKLNVMSSGQIDISKGNTVYCNGKRTNLVLPTLENCRNVLGTAGAFALDLTIIGASGASDFGVYGKSHNSMTGYTTDCYLLNNDHGDNWYATMSQGDVLTLKLIYTGTSFYAYIVNLQN